MFGMLLKAAGSAGQTTCSFLSIQRSDSKPECSSVIFGMLYCGCGPLAGRPAFMRDRVVAGCEYVVPEHHENPKSRTKSPSAPFSV